jgi:hypothetical protein
MERHYLMKREDWNKLHHVIGESHWVATDDPTMILVCVTGAGKGKFARFEQATGHKTIAKDHPAMAHAAKHPLVAPFD